MKAHPRRYGRSAKVIVLAGALLFALLAAEVLVRCLSPQQLGFEFVDGAYRSPTEFTRDMTVNSRGFHDRKHSAPTPGVRRVVLVGDSYVAALSVPVEQTVGQRLEAHLNADAGAAPAWEVIALGREGWGQRKQLTTLQSYGPSLRPDVVVSLFVPFNDVRNNSEALQEVGRLQSERMSRFRPGWTSMPASSAPGLLLESSALNRLLSYWLATARARSDDAEIPVDYHVYAAEPDAEWERAWESTQALLLETRAFAKSLGAGYLLACASTPHGVLGAEEGLRFIQRSYPSMRGGAWDLDLPARRLALFCEENEIPFVDLEPDFRAETGRGSRLHWPYEGHWNVEGNDLAARLLADVILDDGRER